MPFAATKRYIYPPNWDEVYDDNQVGHKRYKVIFTGIAAADALNETNETKLALEMFKTVGGIQPPNKFKIDKIVCLSNVGFTLTTVQFDRAPVEILAAFGDYTTATIDFTESGKYGGYIDEGEGGTGNLTITTTGGTALDSYTIMVEFRVV